MRQSLGSRGSPLPWLLLPLLAGSCGRSAPAPGATDGALETRELARLIKRAADKAERGEPLESLGEMLEEETLAKLQRLADAEPGSVEPLRRLADAYVAAERWDDALATLDRIHTLRPEDGAAFALRAFVLGRLGQREEECRAYERALALEPRNTAWRILHVEALFCAHHYEESHEAYRELLRGGFDDLGPDGGARPFEWIPDQFERVEGETAAHDLGGWSCLYLGLHEDARECFEALLRRAPKDPRGHEGLAWSLTRLGLGEAASGELARLRELDPDASSLRSDRAVALLQEHRPAEALVCLDLALAIDPANELAHNNRGWALFELGRLEEALAAHDRALALRDSFPEAHYNRGLALEALGRRADAILAFERALALDPGDEDARRRLEALR